MVEAAAAAGVRVLYDSPYNRVNHSMAELELEQVAELAKLLAS